MIDLKLQEQKRIETAKKIQSIAETLQTSCHEFTKSIIEQKPTLAYEDARSAWLYMELAAIHHAFDELKDIVSKLN